MHKPWRAHDRDLSDESLIPPDTRFEERELDPPARPDGVRRSESWGAGSPGPSPAAWRSRVPEWVTTALIAVGVVLIAVASTTFFGTLSDKVYGARADILYTAPDGTSDDSRERILATQAELVRSRALLAEVSSATGVPLEDLRSALTVEVGRDDLMRVTIGDEDPERARTLAQTVAVRYLEFTSRLSPEAERGRQLIQDEIDRLTTGGRPVDDVARDRVARLQDRLLDLEVESVTRPKAELLSAAYILDKPLAPDPLRSVALGLIIGLVLATAVVVAMLRQGVTRRR